MRYFYGRVSTKDQNLARQIKAALRFYSHYDEFFSDKQSGKDFNREDYQRMKSIVVAGDEVVVGTIDRLGRNKEGIKEELRWFKVKGVIVRILDIPTTLIDFKGQDWIADMVNNILIEVLGAIAERERVEALVRINDGIDAMPVKNGKKVSIKTGNYMGRPSVEIPDFQKFLKKQKEGRITVKDACEKLDISRSTWYNLAREGAV